jgi:hypothetical protein
MSGCFDLLIYMPDPDNTDSIVTHKWKTHGVGPLKFTTLLHTVTSPLVTHNLIFPLMTNVLALFSTLPRIFYQAFILHHRKRLNVFARPDPYPSIRQSSKNIKSEGIYDKRMALLRSTSRKIFYSFLQRRCQEVNLLLGNPFVQSIVFSSCSDTSSPKTLIISYISP